MRTQNFSDLLFFRSSREKFFACKYRNPRTGNGYEIDLFNFSFY